jgi:hypothetical protein
MCAERKLELLYFKTIFQYFKPEISEYLRNRYKICVI